MESEIFDTIIIGAGPAGIAAAVYCIRKSLKTLVITKDIGGQSALSQDIENYPGFTMIKGSDLAKKFKEELMNFENQGLFLKDGVEVVDLSGAEPRFSVKSSDGNTYSGKTVIIASGRSPRVLGVPGEKELMGKGVATCFTCDAPFYKDLDVAVVGGGNSALDTAFSLIKPARSITIVNNTDSLRGDEILLKNVTSSPKIKVLNNHIVSEILGNEAVGGIKIKDSSTGKEDVLTVSGVYIEIGWTPTTGFDHITNKNEKGEIEVDEYGATSVPGVYAVGDVNNIWGEQIVIAAGEGAKGALRAAEYISKTPHQSTSNIHHG